MLIHNTETKIKMKNGIKRKLDAHRHEPDQGDLQAQIRERAYLLWLQNGRIPNSDLVNWLQAEREVAACLTAPSVTARP